MLRITYRALRVLLLGLVITFTSRVFAESDSAALDKTLSPYFFVENGDPKLDQLPLEATKVNVAISGVIAQVNVTQIYKNDGKRPINARYVFPASTRAAVNGLRMTVRNQVIEAEIKERKQAEQTFEKAKKAGKSATLLEQERPNVFTMSVANILPGDRVEVLLRYTELLVPAEGTYELVFPTVVGPRYSNQAENKASPTSQFVMSPYTKQGKAPTATLEINGTLSSGIPIRDSKSSTHKLQASFDNPNFYRFSLDSSETTGANRDFILQYRLAGDAIQSGLSLYDAGGEKFFLLLVEPPARVPDDVVPPREFVFVVDVSGSMSGFPLDTAKTLLKDLVGKLRPVDKFNVILFSGGSELLSPRSLAATPQNIQAALRTLDNQQGGGGTELLPALERALTLSTEPGLARSFVVVTDGYIEADKKAVDYIAKNLGQANVFAFGIGSSVNRYLIEGLARAGQGEPFVVTKPSDAPSSSQRFADYVRSPVLTDVRVRYDGFDTYAVEPRSIPDVLANRPVVIHGKWRGEPQGSLSISGVTGKGAFSQRFDVKQAQPRIENRALPYLWARSRVSAISDFGFGEPSPGAKGEITSIGLKYSLLTQYTSFVAVSKVVRNPSTPAADVKQPLVMPEGVENSAVAESLDEAAEPELLILFGCLFLLGVLISTQRQRAMRTRVGEA